MSQCFALLDAGMRVLRIFASRADAEAHADYLRSRDGRRSYYVRAYTVEYGQVQP